VKEPGRFSLGGWLLELGAFWRSFQAARRTVRWSGGMGYHRHARRMRESFWRPFRHELDAWLQEWNPRARTLFLVGPSGGYCLPSGFLGRFDRLVAFDLDSEAEARFRTTHSQTLASGKSLRWIRADALALLTEGEGESLLLRELRQAGGGAVLFCNLLGQVRFRWEDPENDPGFRRWTLQFRRTLEQIPEWASFHDRFSGELVPREGRFELPLAPSSSEEWLEVLVARSRNPGAQELLDHLTDSWLPRDRPRTLLRWEFTPGVFHWIECVTSGPSP
jgi:hypothetical protein